MPQVKRALRARFTGTEVVVSDPEYAVVRGVARYAERWEPGGNDGYLVNRTALSYGVRSYVGDTEEERVFNIIKRGDTLPATGESQFATRNEGQTAVEFKVYESHDASDEVEIAAFEGIDERVSVTLPFGKQVPRETPVTAKLSLGADGLLKVEALDREGHVSKAELRIFVGNKEIMV